MLICESCNNKCAMNPQMMKQLISFFALSLLSILGLVAQNQADPLIYRAEKIYTADTGFSVATSMVISNGVILYINRAPIIWYSKRQNTVESSTFGSEFIAMKIAVELIESGANTPEINGIKSGI